MPGVDLARHSKLSAQTVSVILRKLEIDGLLTKGLPVRGRVGKPSIPLGLNDNGAYAFGAKVGRRSSRLVLMDFSGNVCGELMEEHPYPTPSRIMTFLEKGIKTLGKKVKIKKNIAGIGVAAPYELWNWLDNLGAPKRAMNQWRGFDFTSAIAEFSDLEVHIGNDGTLACNAEHVFGIGRDFSNYAYFYLGTFAGGGMVLNDRVYAGRTGNAAAFGTLPVGDVNASEHQLIHKSSLYLLEKMMQQKKRPTNLIGPKQTDWSDVGTVLDDWIEQAARYLAVASVSVCSVIDFQTVIIDGRFPTKVRKRLVERVQHHLKTVDTQGIEPPGIAEGTIGIDASAIGAAYQPIVQSYLLKETVHV